MLFSSLETGGRTCAICSSYRLPRYGNTTSSYRSDENLLAIEAEAEAEAGVDAEAGARAGAEAEAKAELQAEAEAEVEDGAETKASPMLTRSFWLV